MIALTGATGQLGRLVIAALKRQGATDGLVALVRSPEKAADLGVTVRQADYAKPDTLGPALAGVQTLLLISASEVGQRIDQHKNVIDAARAAGVSRIVYTSLLHADTSPLGLAAEHVATEAMLRDSGIATTILRNGWYTENYTAGAGAALTLGTLYGAAGDGKISAATRADFADAAAAALIGDGHAGKVYELAGDTPFTLADLAAEISRQSGKDIPFVNLPEADYAAALAGAGLPAPWPEMLARVDVQVSEGALYHSGHELSALIGRPTTPLADAVAAALANG
ncbi:MAG: SDR family oxidoreductase [Rhodobacteraceae bacterium]|nr:SDR family oxidoreductase [Paracoccaceae bacterium]